LILRKIIEIAATRFRILKLKCAKFDFRWGLSLQRSPGPLAGFKGPTSKGRKDGKEGQGRGEGKGEYGKVGKRREGREGRKGRKGEGGKGCVMAVGGMDPTENHNAY